MSFRIGPISDKVSASVTDIRISSATDIRIESRADSRAETPSTQKEIDDIELRKLSEYFEKSRDDIQKKVNSLLNFEFSANRPKILQDKPSSASSLKSQPLKSAVARNFRPIDLETAITLKELTIGSCVHVLSNEWRRAKFVFRPENTELAYGLLCEKNGSKGLVLSVQTIVLRNLFALGYKDINGQEVINSEWRNQRKILKPTDSERKEALIRSLTQILWTAGDKQYSCVAFNSTFNCFDISSNKQSRYFGDGLTERLHLYDFNDIKSLEAFIRKNIAMFQKDDGCVLFLYSLILSRQIEKLQEDLQGSVLLGDMEECKISLYNLVLTGFASPYLHNGSVYYDSNGEALEKPLIGIKNRSEVGVLYWDPKEDDDKRTEVGSMLKTPKYPIWLILMGKNMIAVLFNTNIDLMNNWRLEQNFNLHLYSGLKKQEDECIIEVSTRDNDGELTPAKALRSKYAKYKLFEEEKDPEIYELIKSKWSDSKISGFWDGKELMTLL